MHRFDYFFLKKDIPGSFLQTTALIHDLRAREEIRQKANSGIFDALKQAAMIDSVSASNEIEGIVTTKSRLQDMLKKDLPPQTHDEQEIAGYRDVLREIYDSYEEMILSEGLIRHFHEQMLFSTSAEAGRYKTEDNYIRQVDHDGSTHIRFVPVPARETASAMAQMLAAYREARQEADINRMLLDCCLILDFLCIHPFTDGNGRVSRLLTSFLFLRNQFDVGCFVSIDKMIKTYLPGYYEALLHSSNGWHENQNSYIPFLTYMLQILYRCYKTLDQKFVEASIHSMPKAKQVAYLLQNSFVPVSKEDIKNRLPDISITTIERVLGRMVKDGSVEKIGTVRDARYRAFPHH